MSNVKARLRKLRRTMIGMMTPEQQEQNKDFVNDLRDIPIGERLSKLERLVERLNTIENPQTPEAPAEKS